ncbi:MULTISPECIES: DUF1707 SHOCT-like domain-containing protein [Kitasatospora]|uniref:DUF1707 domain-containing protein n=1 Tax=Kitasatospora cathayae TaxID=3004092 RepID=A0ABY7QE18_9ACTN|nr:DUF1707 domain-containing protein [Kitasatospora sp. HUAS 3-15]WBP91004.1 DUF1707 domain-containing protein [Kitasatospora sp. HUAS 3-15]
MPGQISLAKSRSDHAAQPAQPALRASHADRDQVVTALSIAAGEGRLTAEELDERVEAALSARTLGELSELTADLPPAPAAAAGDPARPKDVLRIEQNFGKAERTGRWVLPRRLELAGAWSHVTLDFTQAVITQDTLPIDVDLQGGNLTLILGPGMALDPYGLILEFSRIKGHRDPDPDTPVRLRIELAGKKSFGRIVVRRPRTWLPGRRTAALPAGH